MLSNAALKHLQIDLRTYGVSGRTQQQRNGIKAYVAGTLHNRLDRVA